MAAHDALIHLTALGAFLGKKDSRCWRALADTKGGWSKCCAKLDHAFDPLETLQLDSADWEAAGVLAKLRDLGAPDTVCCICDDLDAEGAMMPLADAIKAVFGSGYGAAVSCLPGRLAYFENGDVGIRRISRV